MKSKKFMMISLLMLVGWMITGCSAYGNEVVPADNAGKKSKTADPLSVGNGYVLHPSGVINDTVVDIYQSNDIQSERLTQALYNQPVEVLETKEHWVKVKVPDGSVGWIKSKYVEPDTSSIEGGQSEYKVVVTNKRTKIYSGQVSDVSLKEIVLGTELFARSIGEDACEVILPGNQSGWVRKGGTIQVPVGQKIPKTTAVDLITTVGKFKGTIYLVGGISSYGMDSAGLPYICAKINGVNIPRAVNAQVKKGKDVKVEISSLKAGDLLFFSTSEGQNSISHVGIYTGDKKFIHASKSKGYVVEDSLAEQYFERRLIKVKRWFD